MQNEQSALTLLDYWGIVVRRRWLIIATFVVSLVIAWAVCLFLPKSYRSSTLILVETQKIPEEYVKAIVGGTIEERLTMIQQQVMSRTVLSRVIDEFKLYQDNIRSDGLEHVIERMRKVIKVETVATHGARGKTVEAFSLSFAHEDPMTAMKVTGKLASQFIEENLKVREQLVEGAGAFLEQELIASKIALEKQEQAISDFKTKHMGSLPEQMEANLRALDRLQLDINAANELAQSSTERLALVEKAIKEYEATGSIKPGSDAPSPVRIDPLAGRLRELERTLTALSSEYKDTYPDIIQTRQEIEKVKTQLAEKYKDSGSQSTDVSTTYDPYLRELVKQRNELALELGSLKDRQRRLTVQIKVVESRVEQTPAREQDLTILVRDYENMQKNYQSLLDKRLNARVAENLEKRQKGEQFRVLDPANVPENPEKPNRGLIMLFGLLGGCGLGVGLALGAEHINPTFRRPEDLEKVQGLQVIAAIPDFSFLYSDGHDQGTHSLTEIAKGFRIVRNGSSEEAKSQLLMAPAAAQALNLVAKWHPNSLVAEQYRVAATRLTLLDHDRPSSIVVITSAVKGEGKTTTVINIGYTLARDLGKKVLLVDCDFKRPELRRYVGTTKPHDLVDVLDGRAPWEACASNIDETTCWILPVGRRAEEISDLAKIEQLRGVLTAVRLHFDYILINAPPILPLATMNMLAGLADRLLLIVRAGSTPQLVMQRAIAALGRAGPVPVILNGVEQQTMPYYMQPNYYRASATQSV